MVVGELWFDVEKRYNTTAVSQLTTIVMLWFDVEKRYNTTLAFKVITIFLLWFDVEKRYNTTQDNGKPNAFSCGLM